MAIILSSAHSAALLFVLLAALFDFFDGLAARALKAYSPLGKDLDSLADMVSFGVAPAIVGYSYMTRIAGNYFGDKFWISLLPLFIAVFSALRLAKFNNDKRQSENFIGLATPACAILYISLAAMLSDSETIILQSTSKAWYFWLPAILVPVLCWLLVSEIPMFSMKLKNLSWADNRTRFIFLMIVAVEIAMAIIGGISFQALIVAVITTYIIINLLLLLVASGKPSRQVGK